uniref:Uncharacterized protein n=1 Tax=Glossina pallidipes TaxID=7398 RepID=A0A1A9ZFU4_GLOPL
MLYVAASSGVLPERSASTANKEGKKRIIISPSPVATAAPTSLSAYAPAPGIGESPTLPENNKKLIVLTHGLTPRLNPYVPELFVLSQFWAPAAAATSIIWSLIILLFPLVQPLRQFSNWGSNFANNNTR